MKKIVFLHFDSIPEGRDWNNLTDDEVMNIALSSDDSFIYDSIEEYIEDFNDEWSPSEVSYMGRVINIDEE